MLKQTIKLIKQGNNPISNCLNTERLVSNCLSAERLVSNIANQQIRSQSSGAPSSGSQSNKSTAHPNIEKTTTANLATFPPTKTNTILNFGKEGNMYVIARFGKFRRIANPGIFYTIPLIDTIKEVDMRQMVIDVERQYAFTKDNVSVKIAAQLYVNVNDALVACYNVQQPLIAVVSQAQSAMRTAVGKNELDHISADRDIINESVLKAISDSSKHWGVVVSRFEITEIMPDNKVKEAMDLQSEAERQRRATELNARARKISTELDAEAKKQAIILDAEARKQAIILDAEAQSTASKYLENISHTVLDYYVKNRHIDMVGEVARGGKHNTWFAHRDMTQLPMLQEMFKRDH